MATATGLNATIVRRRLTNQNPQRSLNAKFVRASFWEGWGEKPVRNPALKRSRSRNIGSAIFGVCRYAIARIAAFPFETNPLFLIARNARGDALARYGWKIVRPAPGSLLWSANAGDANGKMSA
jgi:hypothetical protein